MCARYEQEEEGDQEEEEEEENGDEDEEEDLSAFKKKVWGALRHSFSMTSRGRFGVCHDLGFARCLKWTESLAGCGRHVFCRTCLLTLKTPALLGC